MHAVSCIDIGPLTLLFELVDSAASYKRSRSLLRIFLSKLRKHDLEENWISLSTVGSKQKFSHWGFRPNRTPIWRGTASESAKRAQVFAGLYSSVHTCSAPKNSFLRWLRATDDCPETFWGFRRRARSLQSTPPLWQLHQSRMKSSLLFCSLQRMQDGWSKLISNFQPPIKAAPQQCRQKAHFKFSRVCTAVCVEDFLFGETLGETFEAFAIESDLRLSRRKDLERLLKICNNRLVSLFAECVATRNMLHDGWSKLNLNFTRSRESFATARSENRFWGEKLSPWSGQSAG